VAGDARATRIICAPVYETEGCGAGRYSSAIVARRGRAAGPEALRGARFAVNGFDSLSGWALLLDALGADGIGEVEATGSHRASVQAVAEGRADAAAIDAVVWDLAQRFEPAARELEVVGWTAEAPAPPFVTSALRGSGERARMRAALVETLVAPETAAIRAELRLARIVALADPDYDPARRLASLVRAAAGGRPEFAQA
jgi:ABC-type phosphate/phosphonate transport system substrate-binding protein